MCTACVARRIVCASAAPLDCHQPWLSTRVLQPVIMQAILHDNIKFELNQITALKEALKLREQIVRSHAPHVLVKCLA